MSVSSTTSLHTNFLNKVGSMESVPEVPLSAAKIGKRDSIRKPSAPFNYYSKMPKNANKSFRFDINTKDHDLDEIISKSDFSSDDSVNSARGHRKLKQS